MKKATVSGWFSFFGESGKTISAIFTIVMAIATVMILILAIFLSLKAGARMMQATTPEATKAAKTKLIWIGIGLVVGLTATILPTVLWNTVGKFSIAHDAIQKTFY